MTKAELESKHIAELHELAADAGIDRYRMLRREELIERLVAEGGNGSQAAGPASGGQESAEESEDGAKESRESGKESRESGKESQGRAEASRERRPSGRRRRRRRRDRSDDEASEEKPESTSRGASSDAGADDRISGPVEVLAGGGAAVRQAEREAQLTAAQVRRCELRTGDLVEGPVQPGKKDGDALTMVRVESVNGRDPDAGRSPELESLTPVTPTRRIRLEMDRGDVLTRAADILAPLAFGQRVLVRAEPRSGRSTLLRGLAKAISAGPDEVAVSALLVDERPEEVTRWREVIPDAEIHAAPADMHPREQVRVAELALAGAKRRVEAGEDVALFVDSLTRLAVAFNDPFEVKRFFGAGRDLAESGAGSLTVVAVALTTGEQGAAVTQAVATTESTSLELSANLAAEGIVPALVASRPSVAGEELLREGDELQAARRLRAELRLMPVEEAARTLAGRISSTASNAELLGGPS